MVSFINIINKVSYEYLLSSKYDIDWHSMEINITVVKIYVVVLSETFQSVTDRQLWDFIYTMMMYVSGAFLSLVQRSKPSK